MHTVHRDQHRQLDSQLDCQQHRHQLVVIDGEQHCVEHRHHFGELEPDQHSVEHSDLKCEHHSNNIGQLVGNHVGNHIRVVDCDQLGVELGDCQPEASILDDLGADSLDVVELVMALEDEFDIEVPDADVESIRTIGDVERYVSDRAA